MKNKGCYRCTTRVLGCHAVCEKYAEYRKEIDLIKERKEKLYGITEYWNGKKYVVKLGKRTLE